MMEQGHDEDEGAFRKRLDDPFEAGPGCLPFSLSRRASRPKLNLHHGRGENSRVAGAGGDLRGPFRRADQ